MSVKGRFMMRKHRTAGLHERTVLLDGLSSARDLLSEAADMAEAGRADAEARAARTGEWPFAAEMAEGQASVGRRLGPSFTANVARTQSQPVLDRQHRKADPAAPSAGAGTPLPLLIADSLPPLRPQVPAPPRAEPGSSPVLYAGPGWAGRLMRARVANGEWDELPAIVEQGLGRNAAAEAAAHRRYRTRVADAMMERCSAIGRPDLAVTLLHRVDELDHVRRAAEAAAAAVQSGAAAVKSGAR